MIGNSAVVGGMVCRPSQLTEVKELDFFNAIEKSLKRNELEEFKKQATSKANLKKGVTIGDSYFIIEQRPIVLIPLKS